MLQNMDRALRQQLLGTIKENFVCVLHRTHLGYSRSNTLDLLSQLYATYALITNSNWISNDKHLCEAYAPTNPIKVVWCQTNNAPAYANARSTPYSTKQVVNNAYPIIFNTGIFGGFLGVEQADGGRKNPPPYESVFCRIPQVVAPIPSKKYRRPLQNCAQFNHKPGRWVHTI